MVDKSFDWAKKRKLWRKNPMHGEEEVCIVIKDKFSLDDEQGWQSTQRGSFQMEDPLC